MARYSYRRRYNRSGRDKYSVERSAGTISVGTTTTTTNVVPATTIQGMRKIKHMEISFSNTNTTLDSVYWALVYVPQGTTPNGLQRDGGSLYEPNQFVIEAGVLDFTGGPLRIRSRLSRNLNSGDSIVLLTSTNVTTSSIEIAYVVKYAITLQ